MTLVVFDLDGTLLNRDSKISPYTAETLEKMRQKNILYTVATGRTLQAAASPLRNHCFILPMILKNGAIIWCPRKKGYSHHHLLSGSEGWPVLSAFNANDLTPFVFSLDNLQDHVLYHGSLKSTNEQKLAQLFEDERSLPLEPLSEMPEEMGVINVFSVGCESAIKQVRKNITQKQNLVSYSGVAIENQNLHWIDIHHSLGSKGNAIKQLRSELNVQHVVVFGDGDNDITMFQSANESYAPANADPAIINLADQVIGHHDEDGVAHFLRQRFDLF